MGINNGGAYRHARLAPGAFQEPESVHLHIDVGTNLDVLRELRDQLVQYGETPKESFIIERTDGPPGQFSGVLSMPASVNDELVNHLQMVLRHLHDVDVQPVDATLERVIAYVDPAGLTRIANADNLLHWEWIGASFEAEYPETIELHHSIKIPKQSTKPPVTVSQLAAKAEELDSTCWSMFRKPDTWSYRSTTVIHGDVDELIRNGEIERILKRDYAILTSIAKDIAPRARCSIVAEQVLAQWISPLAPEEIHRDRYSFIAGTGASDRGLPKLDDVLAQCRQATAKKLLVRDEEGRSRIMANLNGFRQIVESRGFQPIALELALIPAGVDDYFGSQIVTYAPTTTDAEAILEAWRDISWRNSHSGYSPIMPHPETYRTLYFRVTFKPSDAERPPVRKSKSVTATGAQIFSLTQARMYKPVEDSVVSLYHGVILACPKSYLSLNTALVVVPFQVPRFRGCLFAMVSARDLGERPIRDLATCLSIMLHRTALKEMPVPVVPAPAEATDARQRTELRIQQAREHNKLWTAVEGVANLQPGSRIVRMAATYPEAFALFDQYPELKKIQPEIEQTEKITPIIVMAWKIMSGTEMRRLYEWRKQADIPSRKRQ